MMYNLMINVLEMDRFMDNDEFIRRFGRKPELDDLDRVNCQDKSFGHSQCGICLEHNKPRFMCGCCRGKLPTLPDGWIWIGKEDRWSAYWKAYDDGELDVEVSIVDTVYGPSINCGQIRPPITVIIALLEANEVIEAAQLVSMLAKLYNVK